MAQCPDHHATHDQLRATNGQLGDPAKAAAAIIRVAASADAPLHLLVGEDAYGMADTKIKNLQTDMAQWKDLAVATATEPAQA